MIDAAAITKRSDTGKVVADTGGTTTTAIVNLRHRIKRHEEAVIWRS